MKRITQADLEFLRAGFSYAVGAPHTGIGSYCLSASNGGFALQRIVSHTMATRTILSHGHVPARELHGLMRAAIEGIAEYQRSQSTSAPALPA